MTSPTNGRPRLRTWAALAVLATTCGVVTATGQPASAAATGPITGLAGKCIGAAGGRTANGTAIDLYSCVGDPTQQWTLPGDGTIRTAGKCMDVAGAGTTDGTKVQLWDCNGTSAQQWVHTGSRDLVNPHANKCLDLTGASSADLTVTQIWTCTGGANQKWNVPGGSTPPAPGGFVVSETQFNQMFPNRNGFYSYSGLVAAMSAYPQFTTSGSDTVRRQEAAAFLANVNHETGGLMYVVELNTANYPNYCDWGQPYGCPAGQAAYYGRGPLQLSWNFNYKAAGDALGLNLLGNPWLVQNDSAVAWKTGLWFWMTSTGAGRMTGHDAMVNSAGFGETIRTINGSLECNGANPGQVQSRVDAYQRFTQILGVPAGGNLYC
ncbi:Predicted chitinase [Micromonospora mirobrigensis]|uniref:Predicted chitinase n=1 Tax=Micromonospora mirobrigensis TaxID=262898 RepID=A0A1C4UL44_9ACTN|nr:Predicted chitinase [Micromonospora mirobrigensis]